MSNNLPPVATPDDIATRLGRALSDVERTRTEQLLKDASSQIRRYCRRDFLLHTDETLILRASGGEIKLPNRPVLSVNSVVALSGHAPEIPDIPVTWYAFDGIDRVILSDPNQSGVINLPEAWLEYGSFPGSFAVNHSWGYTAIPDEVEMVAATAVIAVLMAPTMAAGVIGETVGAYSYRLERSGGGLAVALAQADLEALRDFRDTAGTIQIGGY